MTENKRLLNKENNILQNQNIYYADGKEQAKKHLEQFKQNLIESFDEAELREEFIDECNDTEKQESIKLENVDSLFAYKRFHFGYVCGDTGLIDEQAEHQWFIENCCSIKDLKKNWKTVCNKLNEVNKENEQLKEEKYAYLGEITLYKGESTKRKKENEQLKQENEELRQENKKILDIIDNKITELGMDWYGAEDDSKEEKEANLQLNVLEEIRDEIKEILNLIKEE